MQTYQTPAIAQQHRSNLAAQASHRRDVRLARTAGRTTERTATPALSSDHQRSFGWLRRSIRTAI
jgi:hypothetical protein